MNREQDLINALIDLMCKSGCEAFVGNFQRDGAVLAPRQQWSDENIDEAIHYVKYMSEYFGKAEAVAIITSLISKYHINATDLTLPRNDSEKVGLES